MEANQHPVSGADNSKETQATPVQPADTNLKGSPNANRNPSTTESRKNVNGDLNMIQSNQLNEEDNMDQLADAEQQPGELPTDEYIEALKKNKIDGPEGQDELFEEGEKS